MKEKFVVGDVINYSVFSNVTIVEIAEKEYVLQDGVGNIKKVYKHLVDKYGTLVAKT